MPRVREVHPLGLGERIVRSARAADVEGTLPDRASVSVAIGNADGTSRGSRAPHRRPQSPRRARAGESVLRIRDLASESSATTGRSDRRFLRLPISEVFARALSRSRFTDAGRLRTPEQAAVVSPRIRSYRAAARSISCIGNTTTASFLALLSGGVQTSLRRRGASTPPSFLEPFWAPAPPCLDLDHVALRRLRVAVQTPRDGRHEAVRSHARGRRRRARPHPPTRAFAFGRPRFVVAVNEASWRDRDSKHFLGTRLLRFFFRFFLVRGRPRRACERLRYDASTRLTRDDLTVRTSHAWVFQ